jgi:hypothetical protein
VTEFTEEERQLILEAALNPDRAAAEDRMAEAFGTDGQPRGTRYLLACAAADHAVAAATELAHQVTRARASRASVASVRPTPHPTAAARRPDAARPAAPPGRSVRMLEEGASTPAGVLSPIMREQLLRRRYAHDPDGLIRAWVAGET